MAKKLTIRKPKKSPKKIVGDKRITIGYKLEIAALKKEVAKFKKLASIDSLTGALSRMGFMERIQHSLSMFRRRSFKNGTKQHLSLVFIDIDEFKRINDENGGHLAGDNILKNFVHFLRVHLRASDLIGRTGGDEFVLLLEKSNLTAGESVAQKIKSALKNHRLSTGNKKIRISFSFGVASTSEGITNLEKLLREADKRLYEQKNKKNNK